MKAYFLVMAGEIISAIQQITHYFTKMDSSEIMRDKAVIKVKHSYIH